ncbi:peptidoglycan-binding domain-containing protein [Sediminicurvatus halobius]|uniref:Peptidoglycan binding-like domain-containing protein n=1 Tax=Sediminicurvatus halobius TaxID=2182432 RepID=A0A2U2MXX6_9GAMM|nr:peptidoglycan-binding domain-containing protein [Spiribacter halobius]PWG61875.1 hypothetical protein DEM34_14175 [Spiribacter halobius]UEX79251.1 peptidoglycan-binding protein [Spiribacter halobius]
MNRTNLRVLQRVLAQEAGYADSIDGIHGPRTTAAVERMLAARAASLPDGADRWSARRRAVACLQLACHEHEIDAGAIDGLWGPQTDFAADALAERLRTGEAPVPWREETPADHNPNGWPAEEGVQAAFGAPCEVSRVTVPCPWRLQLAWDMRQSVSGISCHERVVESLARVLQRVHGLYGEARLRELGLHRYGGCYNCRRKRRGTTWSTHAWAVAIDWDPAHNRLAWGRDRARLARPEYEDWWRCWEAEGWVSLGRHRNFDWMHVQAVRI